jgi:large subunit ribosomal protein L32e
MEKKSHKLEHRRQLKKRKPFFLRQDGHKRKKLAQNWRRPRGLQNKMRLNKRGYRRHVTVGWKSPVEVRGLSRDGLTMMVVHRVEELASLTPSQHIVIIGKTVGTKNRVVIINAALAQKLTILNVKDPAGYVAAVDARRTRVKEEEKKKQEKKEAASKKATAKKEAPAKDQGIEAIADEETKKEEDKKEKDRILTQKV